MAIITINDLFKNQKKISNNKQRTIKMEVEELGGEIVLKVPNFSELMEVLEKQTTELEKADEIIYYNTLEPNFSDDKLITELKCNNNPQKVVSKVLSEDSRMKISTLLMKVVTENTSYVKVVGEIKNF
ncbi:MAG: hypothetical protein ACRC6E_14845 [Fusobacteriaceae bacterium]